MSLAWEVQVAKAKRQCNFCRKPIPKGEKCLHAGKAEGTSWSVSGNICSSCTEDLKCSANKGGTV